MPNLSVGKALGGLVGLAAIIAVAVGINNLINNQTADAGIDVSNTACEELASAQMAVDDELKERKEKAATNLTDDMEKASDDYWAERRRLEDVKNACETDALLADPCKALFEESSRLAQEILDNIDDGFDQAKADRREQVKKDYDECLKNPPPEETYEGKNAACGAAFAAGNAAAQQARTAAEQTAQAKYDTAVADAESQHSAKVATLAEIAEKCNQPAPTTSISIGGLGAGTGGTTPVQSGSPACTGTFSGYDPEIQKEINRLQSLYQQAQAGGREGGIGGAGTYAAKIAELRSEMLDGPRYCNTDADCGDPKPVCCSGKSVGRVFCSDGECANEVEECEDNEVCAGEPAECVSPGTGSQQQDGVHISRTIPEVGSCSQNLQTLNLQKGSEQSHRFEITGNIPGWVSITPPGGILPNSNVQITYSCNTVQGFGPGTYEVNGTIQIYDAGNNLVNTIPLTISITVTPVEAKAAISVSPNNLQFVYNHAKPVCPLNAGSVQINGPAGSTWSIGSSLPVWLQSASGNSGPVPAAVQLQFPCLLDSYTNQSQSTNVQFIVTTPDGKTQTASVGVSGEFTNFGGGSPEATVPGSNFQIKVEGLEGLKTN